MAQEEQKKPSLEERIINAFELKGGVNGLKMIIGAMLIVCAHQLDAFRDIATNYPDLAKLMESVIPYVQKVSDWLQWILENVGQIMLVIGGGSKLWKFFKK